MSERVIVMSFTEDEVKEILKYMKVANEAANEYGEFRTHIWDPLIFACLIKRFDSYN